MCQTLKQKGGPIIIVFYAHLEVSDVKCRRPFVCIQIVVLVVIIGHAQNVILSEVMG